MSKLTLAPNILDLNVTGDGVGNVDHENDGSMASSLLLDSHVAHLDKTGVLNFDVSLFNYLFLKIIAYLPVFYLISSKFFPEIMK